MEKHDSAWGELVGGLGSIDLRTATLSFVSFLSTSFNQTSFQTISFQTVHPPVVNSVPVQAMLWPKLIGMIWLAGLVAWRQHAPRA